MDARRAEVVTAGQGRHPLRTRSEQSSNHCQRCQHGLRPCPYLQRCTSLNIVITKVGILTVITIWSIYCTPASSSSASWNTRAASAWGTF
eukprot:2500780-Amphidinium_carterae.1